MLILRGHTNSVQALAYAPDGRTLATAGDDRTVRLWDPATGEQRDVFHDHTDAVLALAFAPDGRLLASGGHDKRVVLREPTLAAPPLGLVPFSFSVTGLAFSPDGRWLAQASDFRLRGWNPLPEPPLRIRHQSTEEEWHPLFGGVPQAVWCVAFSPDSELLAAGLSLGLVVFWHVASQTQRRRLVHPSGVNALAFSPDGDKLATVAGRAVKLWDLYRGQGTVLAEHAHNAWTVAFTRDGRHLATGGWDGVVRLWDVQSGQERARFDWGLGRVNAVAFAPDGMTAAAAGTSPDIVVWDVDDFFR